MKSSDFNDIPTKTLLFKRKGGKNELFIDSGTSVY